jgi:hypothetical protein
MMCKEGLIYAFWSKSMERNRTKLASVQGKCIYRKRKQGLWHLLCDTEQALCVCKQRALILRTRDGLYMSRFARDKSGEVTRGCKAQELILTSTSSCCWMGNSTESGEGQSYRGSYKPPPDRICGESNCFARTVCKFGRSNVILLARSDCAQYPHRWLV